MRSSLFSPLTRLCRAAPVVLLAFLCSCGRHLHAPETGSAAASALVADTSAVTLYIPLEKVAMAVVNETRSPHSPMLNGPFFIEVANALLQYEVSQRFTVLPFPLPDTPHTVAPNQTATFQKLLRKRFADTRAAPEKTGEVVRAIARECSVDLIILPLNCSIKETLGRQGGWRGDKYGKSYERPVNCIAEASINLEIWDKSGNQLYRNKAKGMSRQPIFLSLIRTNKPKGNDIVNFSKNIFAPPAIRALSSAIQNVFPAKTSPYTRGRRY